MARKIITAPLTERDLAEYVASSSDFQFEMDVFQYCRGVFKSEHGGYYRDHETGKNRQFDIRAKYSSGPCVLRLAIECKNLDPSRPLLVNCIPRRDFESYHDLILSRPDTPGDKRPKIPFGVSHRCDRYNSLFWPSEHVGKAMAHVSKTEVDEKGVISAEYTGKDTEVYERWGQAVSSAQELIEISVADYSLTNQHFAATAVLPLLVVPDGTLWTVNYTEDGTRVGDPVQADRCDYYLGRTFPGILGENIRGILAGNKDYAVSHLLIFTRAGFSAFVGGIVTQLSRMDGTWQRLFNEAELQKVFSHPTYAHAG